MPSNHLGLGLKLLARAFIIFNNHVQFINKRFSNELSLHTLLNGLKDFSKYHSGFILSTSCQSCLISNFNKSHGKL